jgi:hypothetical protein
MVVADQDDEANVYRISHIEVLLRLRGPLLFSRSSPARRPAPPGRKRR